jgi:hypothetical protein
MKTKLLRQKTTPIIGENIKNIDKLTCEQILNFMLKAENCNQLNTNNMLIPVKNRNKKKLLTLLLLSPRPSKKVSHIAGRRLGDPQSSSEMRSLAGCVLRLRKVSDPIYFLGERKS